MEEKIEVRFITSWDCGTEVVSKAMYYPETGRVTDIEPVNVDELGLQFQDDEWIELPNGSIRYLCNLCHEPAYIIENERCVHCGERFDGCE